MLLTKWCWIAKSRYSRDGSAKRLTPLQLDFQMRFQGLFTEGWVSRGRMGKRNSQLVQSATPNVCFRLNCHSGWDTPLDKKNRKQSIVYLSVKSTSAGGGLPNDAATPTYSFPSANLPQPASEMQTLAQAFEGKWRIEERYEPDEWTPKGGTGYGEEVWRRGPGGFTFMEEVHDHGPTGESFGLALSWWDRDKGFQGLWCENHNPQGCAIGRDVNGSFKWDGKQQIVDNEFSRNGKTFQWHEVFTDITPNSFVQTADIGEKGGPLKRWLTIHATRVQVKPMQDISSGSAEAELRALIAERRKASIEGDVETVAGSMTDDYLQTDIWGSVQDKTAWLSEYFKPLAELIRAGRFHWEVFEEKDIQIRVSGDTAVVMGRMELKGTGARADRDRHTWVADPDAHPALTLRFTRVYVRRDGKWLLAALHNAVPLPPAANK